MNTIYVLSLLAYKYITSFSGNYSCLILFYKTIILNKLIKGFLLLLFLDWLEILGQYVIIHSGSNYHQAPELVDPSVRCDKVSTLTSSVFSHIDMLPSL